MTREEFYENVKTVAQKEGKEYNEPSINKEMWRVIETVYLFHPSISSTYGKEEIALLYHKFGMAVIRDMLPRAQKSQLMAEKLRVVNREREKVMERIEHLANGTDTEERYYFTFGSSKQFPYQDGYIVVIAENRKAATTKFRAKYPDRNEDTINCSEIYSEDEWYACKGTHYHNIEPYETLE